MAIIQRPAKQGGPTTYQGKVALGYVDILASEADADLDTIYAAWNGGVDAVNIRPNAVTSEKIAAGAVGTRELATNGVTWDKIAPNSINTNHIVNGAVTWEKIPNNTINTAHIVNGAVTWEKIPNNTINTDHIVDGAVTVPKLAPALQGPVQGTFPGALTAASITTDTLTVNANSTVAGFGQDRRYASGCIHTAPRTYPIGGPWEIDLATRVIDTTGAAQPNQVRAPNLTAGSTLCVVSFNALLDANAAGGVSFAIKFWNGSTWTTLAEWYSTVSIQVNISTVAYLSAGVLLHAEMVNNSGASRTLTGMNPALLLAYIGTG
jgi:hypothetical protein